MQSKANVRRVRVNGRRGIYYRLGADGKRRYEITYRDSDGRQRWKTVSGGLKDAQTALEDIHGRRRRGERVSPTRATFAEVAEAWLATQTQLRPRTRASYESLLRVHVVPRIGRLRIAEITEDDVAFVIAEMQKGDSKAWTIRTALTPLGRVLSYAARRGFIAVNPIRHLERGERPSPGRREMRILQRGEITALLDVADPRYRPLLAIAVFTGLRLGELLGLAWQDVDLGDGVIHVRKQLDRDGQRVAPKTPQAMRDVVLMPALGRLIREHRLASRHSRPRDLVFASALGTGLDRRNVSRRGLERAVERAGLGDPSRPTLRFHDLRHTFASLLVAQGMNVVFVSRQLGHASPDITLRVYAHLFDSAEHSRRASELLDAEFGAIVASRTTRDVF
ncbi:MAG: site-specific integrase [Actinobacteria bacterium]|nr:site-specific integrase [Actinomycetota bacterium]